MILSRLLALSFACISRLQSATAQSSRSNAPTSQLSTSSTPSTTLSSGLSVSLIDITTAIALPVSAGSRVIPSTSTLVLTTIQSSETITIALSTTSTRPSSTTTPSASPSPTPIHLNTRVDPAFGVLGALLIISGLPLAFWGHKNRWSSFFLLGFYGFALVTFALIYKFGVINHVNAGGNPPSPTLRGLYVLACCVTGVVGGGVAIFFWQTSKYLIGAWGGFAVGLYIQCFHDGGLIKAVGLRWVLYIACGAVGFVLCTIPKLHYYVLLAATAAVGSSAFILGVDCFTTAGLKEFYIYNLGFHFSKFANIPFPLSQTMEIELGLIAAVALMGAAVQFRVPLMLKVRLEQIAEEHKRRDEELEARAAERFPNIQRDREEWEDKHGHKRISSNTPLIQDGSAPPTPSQYSRPLSSAFTLGGRENFSGAPAGGPDRVPQDAGFLPAMDLGGNVKDELPEKMVSRSVLIDDHPELRRKRELLTEIREIRRSIDALNEISPVSTGSRLSLGNMDAAIPRDSALATAARASGRDRVKSMIAMPTPRRVSSLSPPPDARPSSTPLDSKDNYDWDTYVRERKLFVPPAGISPPIPTSPVPEALQRSLSNRVPQSEAIATALENRKRRESAGINVEDLLSRPAPTHASTSSNLPNAHVPITVLAPRRDTAPSAPSAPRVLSYEELTERHKSRMRALQGPLRKATEEEATLAEARARWDRSKAVEKEVMGKRHAEKAAEVDAKLKEREKGKRTTKGPDVGDPEHRRSRRASLNLDKLNSLAGSERVSTASKVEEWQKAQQSTLPEVAADHGRGSRLERNPSTSKPL
ncbi:hypothetical protein BS47DRAFT_1290692 [Hydnum rufescens UP504]|uniref:TM7S3/TM198-like domain-containing protein n=1 Tax=Hydnum rufescens UP504 TaxID=1448309 RepID=A0A9P6DXH8_9AGAM|nr:hypothetical protein BS47DRAFT_1290692 [Hydnum rufescens UP504]